MKELLEKLSAIREDLLAFQAQVTDVKKLADLVEQKPHMTRWLNYREHLWPYMNDHQKSRSLDVYDILYAAAEVTQQGGKDHLTDAVTRRVPQLLADLDDIAKKLEQG